MPKINIPNDILKACRDSHPRFAELSAPALVELAVRHLTHAPLNSSNLLSLLATVGTPSERKARGGLARAAAWADNPKANPSPTVQRSLKPKRGRT